MKKWQSNLCIGIIAMVGLQLASADIDRMFYREPVKAPEKVGSAQNQVQVVSKNDTIKNESKKDVPPTVVTETKPSSEIDSGTCLTLSALNAMSVTELEQINGVGPVLAKRIAEYRGQHGPFKSLDGLNAVKGIGPKKLEKIKTQFKK